MLLRLTFAALCLTFATSTASAAAVTADFEGGEQFSISYRETRSSGGTIAGSIGTTSGTVPAIDGTSAFIQITRTNNANEYGAGFRVDVPIASGSFTSTNAADYSIQADVALVGMQATQFTIVARFQDSTGNTLFGNESLVTQQNALASFPPLTAGDGPITLSANLTDFSFDLFNFAAEIADVASVRLLVNTTAFDPSGAQSPTPTFVVDNFGVFEAVAIPEPSSFALFAFCGATVVFSRRRKA